MFHKGRSHGFFSILIEVISELLALQYNLMLISPEVTEMSLADGFLWIEDFELSDGCPGQV